MISTAANPIEVVQLPSTIPNASSPVSIPNSIEVIPLPQPAPLDLRNIQLSVPSIQDQNDVIIPNHSDQPNNYIEAGPISEYSGGLGIPTDQLHQTIDVGSQGSLPSPDQTSDHTFTRSEPFTIRNEYPPVSQAYVYELLKPYINALVQADSKEALINWIPLVFQGDYQTEILAAVNLAASIEVARDEVIRVMIEKLLSLADKTANGIITPWDLSVARDEQLSILFGPSSSQLPIQVTVGTNTYNHNISQDFAFGLLNMLHGNQEFLIRFGEHQITLDLIRNNYAVNDDRKRTCYLAQLPQGECAFSTPEVIQGLITASEWLNLDSRLYVKDLTGIINETRTTITF